MSGEGGSVKQTECPCGDKSHVAPELAMEIQECFPKHFEDLMKSIRYDSLMDCWLFDRWGMLVGVERDGYIHS